MEDFSIAKRLRNFENEGHIWNLLLKLINNSFWESKGNYNRERDLDMWSYYHKIWWTFAFEKLYRTFERVFHSISKHLEIKKRIKFPPPPRPAHTTLCIQFLGRENNDKNNTLPLRKQICFTVAWGCAEILPLLVKFPHKINFTSFW